MAGYHRYLQLISDLTRGKELIASGMQQEVERCVAALKRARDGARVALVSSGDPGIYGMAGLALELAQARRIAVEIEIVPGVSAAQAAAARLGAPLALDYACISLSDLLVPWRTIRKRLEAVAKADLVVALYNPRSSRRVRQLARAAAILRKYRRDTTPVGIATALGTAEEKVLLTDLAHLLKNDLPIPIGMRTVIIVGNSTSRGLGGRLITPRGYAL